MAWNEPGGNRNDQDPWGTGRRGGGDQGPPDLDEALRKGLDKINKLFGGKGGGGQGGKRGSSGSGFGPILAIIAIVAVGFLVVQSVYTVDEQERAVVLRFGKYHKTVNPGLQFRIPLIDDVRKVQVTNVRSTQTSKQMLTEDENIVNVDLQVQYRISDAQAYVLNVRDPSETLRFATDSSLRHEVGGSDLDEVLTTGRAALAVQVQQRLQSFLDAYGAGLQVVKVNVESTQPPQQVQAAFEDVQRAREDEQRLIEEAQTYRNRVVPEARGRAQRMIEEGTAYRAQIVETAAGETQRFLALLDVFAESPDVTRERLYIETMEKVLGRTSKILVDVDGGNNMMYLPLDRLTQGRANNEQTEGAPDISDTAALDMETLTDRVIQELQNRQGTTTRRAR
ncbi:FtsH protease activity modulator HflK [Hydrocarboniclastica marina]|uniref:Protein HflK n=1 Tax=Hydrocarboniclastica marina TaxID=2259620 RepID=A0A4P7XKZ7_9ALTE|nr:FtsH protease activity modulator HflK [Hydrocarboniclastica marina]QCF26617.1 FtsH protease activity modulator HflK [Hydrocarboniclastica marina]